MIANKRTFIINSRDRQYGTDSNFAYSMLLPNSETFTHAVVLAAVIPKSYYLIATGRNTFTLTELGVDTVIAIPPGNYAGPTFLTVVSALLTAASPNGWLYALTRPNGTVEATTAKITYTVTNNGLDQPSFTFGNNSLFEQFGFPDKSTVTFVNGTLVSTHAVKFILEDTLFLHSNICSSGETDVLTEIYVSNTADFGNINYVCPDVMAYAKPITTASDNLYHFVLTSEDGIEIDLNGLNIVFTLCVFKREDLFGLINSYVKYKLLNNKE